MSRTLTVLSPGLQTTVQDLGRWGHQAAGIPVAGAMDPFAHRRANALVGNPRDAATLEITLSGPTLRFSDQRLCAVTGATFSLAIDGRAVVTDVPFVAAPGALLTFGDRGAGARAYLAVAGGIDVPRVLGSRATHVTTAMGGWQGRALTRGDVLPLGAPHPRVRNEPLPHPTTASTDVLTVRVLAGPQQDCFVEDAVEALVSAPYRVGVQSNRMGFRLEGRPLRHRSTADVISDATPLGSLQVPGAGQPVLLMADRQTTGGYAKLATVISADIGVAAQAAPGDWLQFALVTPAEAVAALLAREGQLLRYEGPA